MDVLLSSRSDAGPLREIPFSINCDGVVEAVLVKEDGEALQVLLTQNHKQNSIFLTRKRVNALKPRFSLKLVKNYLQVQNLPIVIYTMQ